MSDDYSKYNVPEFGVDVPELKTTYTWWTWHPISAKWMKTCWSYDSIDHPQIDTILEQELRYYHKKLVKHDINGYEVVRDIPCTRLDIWDKCLDNLAKGLYAKK